MLAVEGLTQVQAARELIAEPLNPALARSANFTNTFCQVLLMLSGMTEPFGIPLQTRLFRSASRRHWQDNAMTKSSVNGFQ
jgi:hypothetical protein